MALCPCPGISEMLPYSSSFRAGSSRRQSCGTRASRWSLNQRPLLPGDCGELFVQTGDVRRGVGAEGSWESDPQGRGSAVWVPESSERCLCVSAATWQSRGAGRSGGQCGCGPVSGVSCQCSPGLCFVWCSVLCLVIKWGVVVPSGFGGRGRKSSVKWPVCQVLGASVTDLRVTQSTQGPSCPLPPNTHTEGTDLNSERQGGRGWGSWTRARSQEVKRK